MAWSVDTGVQVQNLVTQIHTRLTASGWTDYDPGYAVYNSTNNQGVSQLVQITNCQNSGAAGSGANWQYLQFQGWRAWTAHSGVDGSGVTINQLYYAPANVTATTLVDLYMSVTANRFMIYIQGVVNYRNWAYFGGLDSLAGTDDPGCCLLLTARGQAGSGSTIVVCGSVLMSSGAAGYWGAGIRPIRPYFSTITDTLVASGTLPPTAALGSNPSQYVIFPCCVADDSSFVIRGNLDGVGIMPLAGGTGHLDTVDVGGTTHLIVQPGGSPGANQHPFTGNYLDGLAIAEV